MLDQLFIDLIKNDFIKAIGKHAKNANAKSEDIQIRIKLDAEEGLSYAIFQSWKPLNDKCSFNDVMCIKLDIMGKEQLLAPRIYEMLLKQITIYDADGEKFSAFLFERHRTICCSLHDGNRFVRTCVLNDLFTSE